MVEIRQAKPGDEYELISMFISLSQESDFMLMEPGENKMSAEKQLQLINEYSQSSSQVLFVATDECKIVGFLGGTGGKVKRNHHSIHLAMGVLSSHWRKGIGRQLLQSFCVWASNNNFHRIELSVTESNTRAKSLYESCGFETEGIKKHSLIINGCYINEYHMAKII